MKNNRNELCHCGSGLKYKKCCLNKDSETHQQIKYSIPSILSFLRFGLENIDTLKGSDRKVKVKDISVLNETTLHCQFYSYSENSIDIKIEIATIMGFFNSFLKGDQFGNISFSYYAVRAFNDQDKEILYAISSKETAELISKGNSIDWLKSTLFQENTNDYRLSQAKKIISEIENALRFVVKDILLKQFGKDWWNKANNNKLGESVKKTYFEQFGNETSDGEILIKYTFPLQLKKIILTNWKQFTHLFASKTNFEDSMDKLNEIRREEAHNREISEQHLVELKNVYDSLLKNISLKYEQMSLNYLVDNWKLKIKSIMNNKYQPVFDADEVVNEIDLTKKLLKSTASILNLIEYLDDTILKLDSVLVPIQKKEIHNDLVRVFRTYRDLQQELIENVRLGKIEKIENIILAINLEKKKMNAFAERFLLSES